MVLYTCQNCLKEFKKKDDFIKHTERRKKPCEPIKIQIQINPDESKKIQILENFNDNIENFENNKNFSCNFCNKIFFNNSNLNKHLKNSRKVSLEWKRETSRFYSSKPFRLLHLEPS